MPANVIGEAFAALAFWPAVGAFVLYGVGGLLWGVFQFEDATGWHSCVIDTCEGNHIGSPVLLVLILSWSGAMLLSGLCAVVAFCDLAMLAVSRKMPPGQSFLSVGLCSLAFAIGITDWMWVGGRSPAGALTDLSRFALFGSVNFSVTSGLSLVSIGYGVVATFRRRRLAGLPLAALSFGVATLASYAWWWNFTDRSI